MSPLVLIVFLSASRAAVLPDNPDTTTTTESDLLPTTTASSENEKTLNPFISEEKDSSEKQPESPTTSRNFIQEFRQKSHLFTSNFGSNKSQGLHPLGDELLHALDGTRHLLTGDKTRNKPRSLYDKILWPPSCNSTAAPPTTPSTNAEDEIHSSPRDQIVSHITLVLQRNSSSQDEDSSPGGSGSNRVPFIGRQPYTGSIFVSEQGDIDIFKKVNPEKMRKEKLEREKASEVISEWLTSHPDLSKYNNQAINFSNPGIGDFLSILGMGAMLQDVTGTNKTLG